MPPEETIVDQPSLASTSGPVKPSSSSAPSSLSSTTFPSLVDIKKQIPAKYFQASIPLSLYYVARSVVFVLTTTVLALLVTLPSSPYYLQDIRVRALAWVIYWAVQGTLFWGIFTLGHDCGHASFSKYKALNQIFGNILHSFLLVPYESWKLTHNHHHKNTGHIDNDEVFYPHRTNEFYDQVRRFVVVIMGPAWYIYLYGRRHFWPVEGDNLFKGREFDVTVSHTSWFLMLSLVVYATKTLGSSIVLYYYFAPLTMFASWLVVTTFLHHSDPDTPWYSGEEWNYVKGNLSSVDRSYGYGINNVIHNIGTHQIHHLFPIIPHYYLVEATEHFRKAFPHLVRISDESIMSAFFRNWSYYLRFGHSVSKDTTVFRYRDAEKLATKLAKIEKRR